MRQKFDELKKNYDAFESKTASYRSEAAGVSDLGRINHNTLLL